MYGSFICIVGDNLVLNVFVVVTPTTVTHQAPLSMGFPRQEYWSELPFPSPEDLHGPEIKPMPSASIFHIAGGFFTNEPPGKPPLNILLFVYPPVN